MHASAIDTLLTDKERKLFIAFQTGGIATRPMLRWYVTAVGGSILLASFAIWQNDVVWSIVDHAILFFIIGAGLLGARDLTHRIAGMIAKYDEVVRQLTVIPTESIAGQGELE